MPGESVNTVKWAESNINVIKKANVKTNFIKGEMDNYNLNNSSLGEKEARKKPRHYI